MTTETNQSPPGRAAPEEASRLPTQLRYVILVTMLGSFMANLDSTIVNVALRTLSVEMDSPLTSVQWLVTVYLLAMAVAIPASAWAASRFGAMQMYVLAITVFTVASLACGLAQTTGQLIAFRAFQGIGGGMAMPLAQLLIVRTAGPKLMARAMSVNAAPTILAPILGPVAGGILLQHVGWQWIFYVNVPIGIITVLLAVKLLTRDEPGKGAHLDVTGLALLAAGSVALTYGLAEIGDTGEFGSPVVLGSLAAGVLLTAAFAVYALRAQRPLLDLRLFRSKVYSAASLTNVCLGATVFGAIILLPLYFQIVRGEDTVNTGLLLIPQGLGAAVAIWFAARLIDRYGSGVTALLGGLLTIVSTVPFVLVQADTSYWLLGIAMVVRGFGIGASVVPAVTAAYRAIPPTKIQDATVQVSVGQRVGGSLGTAIFAVILERQLDGASDAPAMAAGFATTFWWVLAVAVVATLPSLLLISAERRAARAAADPTAAEPAAH